MRNRLTDQALLLLRAYWQPALMGFLGLMIVSQLAVFAWRAIELNRISTLIAEASEISPQPAEEEQEASNRQSNRGGEEQQQPSRNIFIKERTEYQLTAIYMNKAYINGQEVQEGDRVGRAEVIEIDPMSVTIQEEMSDDTQTLTLFQGGGGGRRAPMRRPQREERRPQEEEDNEEQEGGGNVQPERPGGFGGMGNMNFQQMRQRFQNMSPGQREEMRERFRSLSPEQRAEIRERFRGRGGPRGGR